MNTASVIEISIGAIFINNLILTRMLGLCPFFCLFRNISGAMGFGITVTFVMGIASACTWIINGFVLIPHDLGYLQLIVFILIIVTIVHPTEMALQKFSPKLNESIGTHFSFITTNCAILAVALINAQENPITGGRFTFSEALINSIASGIGYTIAILLMLGIREKLELVNVWKSMKGLPIALISAGLMAMALWGFIGLHFSSGAGGM